MIAVLLLVGTIAFAQPERGKRPNPEEMIQKEKESVLNLDGITDEQTAKIEEAYASMKTQAEELRKNSEGEREAVREKMQALRKEKDEKLASILSEEQYDAYKELDPRKGKRDRKAE